MKILVLQGSPQPNGNTQAVLNPVVAAAGDLATEICWRIAKHCENKWLGALVVDHDAASDAVRIDPDLARRARTFGQKLASGTSAVCV